MSVTLTLARNQYINLSGAAMSARRRLIEVSNAILNNDTKTKKLICDNYKNFDYDIEGEECTKSSINVHLFNRLGVCVFCRKIKDAQ